MSTSRPPPPPKVPFGYLAQFDTEYNTYYYVNTSTGESSWELPAVAAVTQATTAAATHLAPTSITQTYSAHSSAHTSAQNSPSLTPQNLYPTHSNTSVNKIDNIYAPAAQGEAPPPSYNESFGLENLHISKTQQNVALATAGVAAAVGVGAYALQNRTDLPPPPGPENFYGARHAHVVQ